MLQLIILYFIKKWNETKHDLNDLDFLFEYTKFLIPNADSSNFIIFKKQKLLLRFFLFPVIQKWKVESLYRNKI